MPRTRFAAALTRRRTAAVVVTVALALVAGAAPALA
ncbi:MAG: hypothetical protein JWN57_2343, partial [Frankiales bacterium]|nr:hypothetical protein [Frankiales bacterium]